jgi:CubicO group peptidase (beta-lactamase class C family)
MSILSGGFADSKFASMRKVFDAILSESPHSGSSLSIWEDGHEVVNLWGGVTDPESNVAWDRETLSVIFSCTKGLMALLIAQLFEKGAICYDDLVSKYWPEFAQNGKSKTTIKDLVSHRAGLPYLANELSLSEVLNWQFMVKQLEIQEPLWNPGDAYAYHAITHGWLTGEIIKRISGKTAGEHLKEQLAQPLGASTWVGLPSDKEENVAQMYARGDLLEFFETLAENDTEVGNFIIRGLTLGNAFPVTLVSKNGGFNAEEVHQSEIPAAGGISTASGLAKIWSSSVVETDGVRFISDKTVESVTQVQSQGKPFIDIDPPYMKFGMGFQLDSDARPYLSNKSFGHDGAGGQCSFADSTHKIGFAFLTNEMGGGENDDRRATRLIEELKAILSVA